MPKLYITANFDVYSFCLCSLFPDMY